MPIFAKRFASLPILIPTLLFESQFNITQYHAVCTVGENTNTANNSIEHTLLS